MKNTKTLLILVILLILGGVGYLYSQGQPATEIKQKYVGTEAKVTSLKELILQNKSMQCTYSYASGEDSTEGTFYVDSKRVRADMTSTIQDGSENKTHMIQDGEKMYVWDDSSPENGYMMTIPDNFDEMTDEAMKTDETIPTAPEAEQKEMFDTTYEGEYNCNAWKVDESYFVPPTDVNFTDFDSFMQDYKPFMQELQERY